MAVLDSCMDTEAGLFNLQHYVLNARRMFVTCPRRVLGACNAFLKKDLRIAEDGEFVVHSGLKPGRSPKDKRPVELCTTLMPANTHTEVALAPK
jgi:hypothetical protein